MLTITVLADLLRKIKPSVGCEINSSTDIIKDLAFDSMDILMLVDEIEQSLAISIDDTDFEIDSLSSVDKFLFSINKR